MSWQNEHEAVATVNIAGDLTIVLTLKDRASYTERWMRYADSTSLPFRVLIADGSSDDSAASVLSDRSRFRNVTYEYVRYPHDKTYADYHAKIADALGRVKTPFVTLADNDDFFLADCMLESVNFLAEHPDYVACGGQGALFWVGGTSSSSRTADALYGGQVAWKCSRANQSIDAETARNRLQTLSTSKSDTYYYDVKRIAELRKQFQIVRDLNLHDLFLVEWLVFYLTSIAGKTKRLERLYLVRQQDSPGSTGGMHADKYGDWFGRMLLDSWSEDFGKFANVLSASLADADGISIDEARSHLIKTYRMSVAPQLLSDLLDEPTVSAMMPVIVTAVRRLVGLSEDSFLKGLARKLYRRVNLLSLDSVYGTRILAAPVQNARNDIQPVLAFLGQQQR